VPYRKFHPGLDAVITDEQLDAFIDGIPLALEEPPVRIWPVVLTAAAVGTAVGFLTGIVAAGYLNLAQACAALLAVACAVAAVVWYEQHP
jgi:hypothetical protein